MSQCGLRVATANGVSQDFALNKIIDKTSAALKLLENNLCFMAIS